MKKRKPPVVLATCLVIMLVAVGIIYAPKGSSDGHVEPTAPPPSAETGERPTLSSSQISSMASSAMKGDGPVQGKPGAATVDGPSIAMPKVIDSKPKPNDASTSTQWYTDQTRK